MEEKRPTARPAAPPSAKGRAETTGQTTSAADKGTNAATQAASAAEQVTPAATQTAFQPEPVPPTKRKKREDYLPLRIVTMVFYLAIACFLLYQLTDCAIKMYHKDPTSGLNLALFLIIFVLVWGSIANLVPTVMAIVGAVLSKKRMNARGEKGAPAYFTVMAILPYATELIVIGICYLLPHLFP